MTPAASDDDALRWYDRDPALRRAMAQLRDAEDRYQAQVALNIIKIIVEHQSGFEGVVENDAVDHETLQRMLADCDTPQARSRRRRWYDVNETLRSAMRLLKDCPVEVQRMILPAVVRMIEETLAGSEDPSPMA
ncbi:MAG: hypothetical protein IPK79_06070 [Vampirovibrionales bacterium]|nr:hypothetical protein [Vampirovibrionales bacterium]